MKSDDTYSCVEENEITYGIEFEIQRFVLNQTSNMKYKWYNTSY